MILDQARFVVVHSGSFGQEHNRIELIKHLVIGVCVRANDGPLLVGSQLVQKLDDTVGFLVAEVVCRSIKENKLFISDESCGNCSAPTLTS